MENTMSQRLDELLSSDEESLLSKSILAGVIVMGVLAILMVLFWAMPSRADDSKTRVINFTTNACGEFNGNWSEAAMAKAWRESTTYRCDLGPGANAYCVTVTDGKSFTFIGFFVWKTKSSFFIEAKNTQNNDVIFQATCTGRSCRSADVRIFNDSTKRGMACVKL
jgi:hypothetical protein